MLLFYPRHLDRVLQSTLALVKLRKQALLGKKTTKLSVLRRVN